ncbi:MAG: metallophosphoesterase [Candidatus Nanoarchaeia archaeon]|nr:metallophosphoesterase [Candidatus Nanoarchaeia archaeon]MDD5588319.1 metallophosphoesterase [Candidatus Nanoarchaeia archaeon]
MYLYKNKERVLAKDLFLYLEKEKMLILSDLHIGLEEAMNKQGILLPRFQFQELVKRIEKVFKELEIKKIIVNGDLKHEFGTISSQEWSQTLKIINILSTKAELILVKGNHDTILGPIAEKKDIKVLEYYKVNDIYICHGHKIPENKDFKDSKLVIIGHEHPAVSFKERPTEKFKCFLVGKYKNKTLIVQPSLNLISEGTNVTKEKLLSPFLKNLKDFKVYVFEKELYKFGKLKDIN